MTLTLMFKCIFLGQCIFSVLGTVIDPQIPGSGPAVHIHCLSSQHVIQIKNPFSPSLIHDKKFIAVEWYQLVPSDSNKKATETLLLQFLENKTNVPLEKFTVFEFWGLQINNVGLNDSATYTARLVHLGSGQVWSIHIVVATPPVLESEKLSVSRAVSKDGKSVNMFCGQFSSLGSPPVSLLWKTDNGTVMPAVYLDGFLQMTLTSELDAEKHMCDFDFSAPAVKCIAEKDMPRFNWALTQSSKSESADMTNVIVSVTAAVAVVIIILLVTVIVMRRRCTKPEVYNAREHEKKRDQENGQDNAASLYKDDEKLHERSQTSIYNGFPSQDPFMVSKVSNGNIFKKAKPQNSPTKDMVYLNGKQNTLSDKCDNQIEGKWEQKQNNDNRNKKQFKEVEPPQTMPRNVFLSPSMEELDKTGRAFNGGMDNRTDINRGTLV